MRASYKILRRRLRTANALTCGICAIICFGLLFSLNSQQTRPDWQPPPWKCPLNETRLVESAYLSIGLFSPHDGEDNTWPEVIRRIGESAVEVGSQGWKCLMLTDPSSYATADAVVYRAIDLNTALYPVYRCPWQYWVHYNDRSPVDSEIDMNNWRKAGAIEFNLSMSYHHAADVRFSFGKFVPRNSSDKVRDEQVSRFIINFFKRTRKALWIVGDKCKTASEREHLFQKLRENNIEIDVVGSCPFATKPSVIESELYNYRFYFAFEDAYCDDYLKEAHTAIRLNYKYGVIPVIYTGASTTIVDKELPPGSFIDARDVQQIDQVAEQLNALSGSHGELSTVASYYAWQKSFRVDDKQHLVEAFESLCQSLWSLKLSNRNFHYNKLKSIQFLQGRCYSWHVPPRNIVSN